jgi:hypothetical protein
MRSAGEEGEEQRERANRVRSSGDALTGFNRPRLSRRAFFVGASGANHPRVNSSAGAIRLQSLRLPRRFFLQLESRCLRSIIDYHLLPRANTHADRVAQLQGRIDNRFSIRG